MGQITLPSKLNFQTSARDMEIQSAMQKIVYPVHTPHRFFYPQSPYAGGGGGGGISGMRGGRGMRGDVVTYNGCVPYDYYGFLEAFRAAGLITDCGVAPYTSSPSAQYTCVQQNQPILNRIQDWAGTCISPAQLPTNYVPTPGSAGSPSSPGAILWGNYPNGATTLPSQTIVPAGYAPPPPGSVTPPPGSTTTSTGGTSTGTSTGTSSTSGGTPATGGSPASGGSPSAGTGTGELIPGVSNAYLMLGAAGILMLTIMGGRR